MLEIIYMLAWEERQTQLRRTGNLALEIKNGCGNRGCRWVEKVTPSTVENKRNKQHI